MSNAKKQLYHTFYQVVRDVNSSLDPETVLHKIAEKVSWAMDVKACTIRLLSRDEKYLLASGQYGLSKGYMIKGKVEVSKSAIDQEVLSGKTVYVKDARSDNRFQYPENAQEEGIVSVIVLPLIKEGEKTIGVLRAYSGTEREFSEEEVEFLNAMADICAIAIENAHLHAKLKSDYELLAAYEFQLFED